MGTIIPDIENEFFSKVISGISEVAESYHYNIVFLGTNETLEKEHDFLENCGKPEAEGRNHNADFRDRHGYQGLSAAPAWRNPGIPVVLVDRDVKGAQFDGVFVDNQRGSYDGVMELIKAGHERIAIITGPETSKPGKDRCQGYLQAMEDSGLSVPEEYVACGDFKIAKAYECTGRLLGLRNRPQPSLRPTTCPPWDALSI